MNKHIAIYVRVSTGSQNTRSQMPDLRRWAKGQDLPVKFYEDVGSGKNMTRPAWLELEQAIHAGEVATVCVWRLDRLGRTAAGLTNLFEELQDRKVNLVSLKDGLDLTTPSGRLMANMLASVAQFETEIRAERVKAGQAAARAAGKHWGGSPKGRRKKLRAEHLTAIKQLYAVGTPITRIAKTLGLSRPTVYTVLRPQEPACA